MGAKKSNPLDEDVSQGKYTRQTPADTSSVYPSIYQIKQ